MNNCYDIRDIKEVYKENGVIKTRMVSFNDYKIHGASSYLNGSRYYCIENNEEKELIPHRIRYEAEQEKLLEEKLKSNTNIKKPKYKNAAEFNKWSCFYERIPFVIIISVAVAFFTNIDWAALIVGGIYIIYGIWKHNDVLH